MAKPDEPPTSPDPGGVQKLIDRIRADAVEAGRTEAAALIERARIDAAATLETATRERDELLAKARADIEIERKAAHAAVHTAARDVILNLKSGVVASFEAHVTRLVTQTLQEPQLLRSLVLALGGRVATEVVAKQLAAGQQVEILVSALLAEPPENSTPPAVRDAILGITRAMLREGVELRGSGKVAAGAKIRLVGEAVEVDLTADAISQLLLAYLTPRFRWILEGTD